jgi:hypothetical protein
MREDSGLGLCLGFQRAILTQERWNLGRKRGQEERNWRTRSHFEMLLKTTSSP